MREGLLNRSGGRGDSNYMMAVLSDGIRFYGYAIEQLTEKRLKNREARWETYVGARKELNADKKVYMRLYLIETSVYTRKINFRCPKNHPK